MVELWFTVGAEGLEKRLAQTWCLRSPWTDLVINFHVGSKGKEGKETKRQGQTDTGRDTERDSKDSVWSNSHSLEIFYSPRSRAWTSKNLPR